MKRWQYLKAGDGLTQVRKPGGVGFIKQSPQWIDVSESPDFYSKQIRKSLLISLAEADARPEAKEPQPVKELSGTERLKQARIDLDNTVDAIGDTQEQITKLKASASENKDKDLASVLRAEIEAFENRLKILTKNKQNLEIELKPSGKDGKKESNK